MKIAIRHLLLGTTALIAIGCSSTDSDSMSAGELALKNAGNSLDGSGLCAAVMQINSACPPDLAWDNHGQYVSCVTHYLKARLAAGDIDEEQIGELVSVAARSLIGKKKDGKHPYPDFDLGDCDAPDGGVGGADGVGGHGGDDDDHDRGGDDGHACGGDSGRDDGGHGGDGDDDDGDGDDGGKGGSAGSDQNEAGADSGWGGYP